MSCSSAVRIRCARSRLRKTFTKVHYNFVCTTNAHYIQCTCEHITYTYTCIRLHGKCVRITSWTWSTTSAQTRSIALCWAHFGFAMWLSRSHARVDCTRIYRRFALSMQREDRAKNSADARAASSLTCPSHENDCTHRKEILCDPFRKKILFSPAIARRRRLVQCFAISLFNILCDRHCVHVCVFFLDTNCATLHMQHNGKMVMTACERWSDLMHTSYGQSIDARCVCWQKSKSYMRNYEEFVCSVWPLRIRRSWSARVGLVNTRINCDYADIICAVALQDQHKCLPLWNICFIVCGYKTRELLSYIRCTIFVYFLFLLHCIPLIQSNNVSSLHMHLQRKNHLPTQRWLDWWYLDSAPNNIVSLSSTFDILDRRDSKFCLFKKWEGATHCLST